MTTTPRSGPCAPWITTADLAGQTWPVGTAPPEDILATQAMAASEILYALSGRQFTGECGPVTIRPVARPTDVDTRLGTRGVPSGYLGSGMGATAWGGPQSGGINRYGTADPPVIDLGAYPITGITEVKIDGVLIPPNEYRLVGFQQLQRIRPSAGATPTERYGWPVNQLVDLPDTEPGTFSVSYTYGTAPPSSGANAALALAHQLTLNAMGAPNGLPQRMTSVTRQGVSVAVVDVMDFFSKGLTGIYEVDLFIRTYNPSGSTHRPLVFSPDLGRPRRMPAGG